MKRWSLIAGMAAVLVMLVCVGTVLALDTLYEYYDTTANKDNDPRIYGTSWIAQSFTPSTSHTITEVAVYIREAGTTVGGDLNIQIYDTNESGWPTGSAIGSGALTQAEIGTYAFYVCELSAPASVTASTKYAIVLWTAGGDSSNCYQWGQDASAAPYANGQALSSTNSGSDWIVYTTKDQFFREYGTEPPPPPSSTGTHYSGRGIGRGLGRGIMR